MKYIWLSILLTGCVTPVKHKLPDVPTHLTGRCIDLIQIAQDEDRLTEFLKVVSKNYTLYYDCANRHESFLNWYNEQKVIHDEVFNVEKVFNK